MPARLIAEEGPSLGLILPLEEGAEWVVGRDPDAADFVLEDSTVSRKHFRLTKEADGIYFKNLSRTNPALINDQEFNEPVLLKEGDRIHVGDMVFRYTEEAAAEEKTPPKKKKKGGYDAIFGEEEPISSPPPPKEPTAYDTIFEPGEEELPFNLISESPLLLKVISGPNAGAEIGIEKGRVYTIGKDPNSCDIVFQDMSVSRNHARMVVSDEGTIDIEDLGSKNGTMVNGSALQERKTITPQDLVAMGTTIFMIIDRQAPQETIYSPATPSYETPHLEGSIPVSPEELEAAAPKEDSWKQIPIPKEYLIAAGSFAAIFLIVFLSFFSLFKSKGVEMAHKEPIHLIKEALAKFEGVQYSYNPGMGKLFLVGHVQTAVEYQEMQFRIGELEYITSVEDTVVIDEGVAKMMNDLISSNPSWKGVSIQLEKPGRFACLGYIGTVADATKLSDYLTVNFPYLDRLENKVVVEEVLGTQLAGMIAETGLGAVTYTLSNGDVVLSGRYNEKLKSEYQSLLKHIQMTPGVASVKNYAIATHANLAAIDLTAQYQITGSASFDGTGYSVLLNGKIYMLGDQVDGMQIASIEPNTILLEKDGLKYKISYTR